MAPTTATLHHEDRDAARRFIFWHAVHTAFILPRPPAPPARQRHPHVGDRAAPAQQPPRTRATEARDTHGRRPRRVLHAPLRDPAGADFHVNSSALPLVDFALQDSWAGRLPVSNKTGDDRHLFFWYWPAGISDASDTLTIWLNGGPGCSSLTGFLEENGPISFQPGASAPSANPYAWTGASDVVWIDQPVGTGFATGTVDIHNEFELGDEFYGFLQQFYGVFPELASKKLFITGESYAGFYVPFIASRILHASAAEQAALPLDVQGLLINDGVYSSFITSQEAPIASFAAANQKELGLSNAQIAKFKNLSASCGYDELLAQVTYPPKGEILLPNGNKDQISQRCDIWDQFYKDAMDSNECYNVYRFTDQCPTPSDPLEPYFSRKDVQTALHVPNSGSFSECSNDAVFVDDNDDSPYSETLFPDLLSRLPRGLTLWHGLLDSLLLNVGDRTTIQNLTWNGAQGFSKPPTVRLVVNGTQRGAYQSERGFTYIEVNGAGHMIPEDQPETALHVFQSVLGQVAL
ncbi:hypothetical protein EWM64_g2266 [Hericium alpestre]|uniref:Carboxypeptidase n=1 Tax=Hericium alpestre TaxID=135208 RepID=A0A4Z0A4V7_9AGAM|nr:hypothetical protein EWM64_g2266 [Hericium alpestre]